MQEKYAQLALENTVRLLGIDSPSGYTENAAKYVQAQFAQMGYDAKITRKGGVLIDLGGEDAQDALLLEAHTAWSRRLRATAACASRTWAA